ncbi:MAG: TIGR03013 family PEP-CTERM/XrtA system glycosyltransferase [Deltaproteobacteria bacterium]|nr:TIGR03013 family PEP-CTERM/XrtA system glycosyltransferase [Deltaproteobacteria bacterium]
MIKLFGKYFSVRKILFIFGEGFLIFCAVTLATYFLLGRSIGIPEILKADWMKILLVAVTAQVSLYLNDLYEIQPTGNIIDLVTKLTQAVGITSIILAVIYYLWPGTMIGRWIFFASLVILILFLVSWRVLYTYVIYKRFFSEKALIVGDGELAGDICAEIKNKSELTYDVRYVVGLRMGNGPHKRLNGIPVRYGFDDLCDLAEAEQVSSIIVALDQKRGIMPYKELLNCKVRGISVIDGETFYERITGKLLVDRISPSWLIFSDGFVKSPVTKLIKRAAGFFMSALMLIITSPLLLLVALAIKLESEGPILFSQERVGENEKIFMIYKFRSMRANAEKDSGPVWAGENDPRITKVGKIIRKLRIDELPQLWNVLKGDMSFVGPRPERPFFVERLKKTIPYYVERFSVKPGITGWAQVNYEYGASDEDSKEKLKYDLYYIKNMSLMLDVLVLFQTIKTVLLGRGSR